jgi:hypothetical protein
MSLSSGGRVEPWRSASCRGAPILAVAPCWFWSKSVDEDQTLRRDLVLVLGLLCPSPSDVGTVAFASHYGFFEAQLLGMHEAPDRPVINVETAFGKFGHQPALGKVLLCPLQQSGTVRA